MPKKWKKCKSTNTTAEWNNPIHLLTHPSGSDLPKEPVWWMWWGRNAGEIEGLRTCHFSAGVKKKMWLDWLPIACLMLSSCLCRWVLLVAVEDLRFCFCFQRWFKIKQPIEQKRIFWTGLMLETVPQFWIYRNDWKRRNESIKKKFFKKRPLNLAGENVKKKIKKISWVSWLNFCEGLNELTHNHN